jgi:site-specific recombinase XerD
MVHVTREDGFRKCPRLTSSTILLCPKAANRAAQWGRMQGMTDLTSREEVGKQDIQRWIVRLLDRYSGAYASNQYRALQQFFKWLAAEEEVSDPMAGLKPPGVPDKPVPVFAAGTCRDWSAPARAARSRSAATPP